MIPGSEKIRFAETLPYKRIVAGNPALSVQFGHNLQEVVYLVQLPEGIIFTAGLTHTPVPGSENVAWSDIGHVVRVVVALESTPLIDSVCRELVRVYSINVRT